MEIRLLHDHEVPMAKELWGYAFEKDEPFFSWYFKDVFKAKNCMGVFINGKLASCLQIPPYKLNINGSPYDSSYVVGVVTGPEYRNKGIMKALIKKTIAEIHGRNHYISILMPFDTFFYKPYGWELCYGHLNYSVPVGILKGLSHREGNFKKIDFHKDIPGLDKIYSEYIKNQNGYVLRSRENWWVLLQDLYHYGGFSIQVLNDEDEPMGYIQYLIKGDKLMVREIAYRNQWAKRALLGFLYSHYSQVNTVEWPAPTNDKTYLSLRDTIKPSPTNTITLSPFMCSRLIDVKNALEHSTYPGVNADFSMKIEDGYAPWNNTTFHVVVKNGKVTVEEDKNKTPDLETSINVLTQLFMGALDMDEVISSELAAVRSNFHEMSKIFVKKNNFINEYY